MMKIIKHLIKYIKIMFKIKNYLIYVFKKKFNKLIKDYGF